jgi:prephenate dehydrogenase
MWSAICIDNADLLEDALAAIELGIGKIRSAIAAGDANAVHELFAQARRWAEDGQGGT